MAALKPFGAQDSIEALHGLVGSEMYQDHTESWINISQKVTESELTASLSKAQTCTLLQVARRRVARAHHLVPRC